MADTFIRWGIAAPLKRSKRAALADLDFCIPEADRDNFRVVPSKAYPSRWEIQYGRKVSVDPSKPVSFVRIK